MNNSVFVKRNIFFHTDEPAEDKFEKKCVNECEKDVLF